MKLLLALAFPYLGFALGSATGVGERTTVGLAKRSTISEILTDIEDATSCTACEVAAALQYFILANERLNPSRRFCWCFRP